MLRLTAKKQTPHRVVLAIEGNIAGDQVHLLKEEGRRHLATGARLILELDGVYFIDEAGLALLRQWSAPG